VAHSLSAKKRIRQNKVSRARNRARKNQIKLMVRSFNETLTAGDAAKSAESLRAAIKKIDQVAAKGTIHKNAASRKKSQLQRKLNALSAQS
jgi:small subunit ribosomal protein S20